jgi:hypothetical protein
MSIQTDTATIELKEKVLSVLLKQGYTLDGNGFVLENNSRENRRDVHLTAKAERMCENEDFIEKNLLTIKKYLVSGCDIEIDKIQPEIIEVVEGSLYEKIFKWWNLVWWSLPYERAYGRQMRFVIWDKYHNAPIGLIGLQSPILNWSVRDKKLGIPKDQLDYWVNQSMSAQRLGALPPYNYLLGGKLVASLMTTDVIRDLFTKKYAGKQTILKKREIPARLLFFTTTGAYGKSSVYNKIKINEDIVSKFIGYTQGSGSFHIPNSLFDDFIKYLSDKEFNVKRGYGTGPSTKMRLINKAMGLLGFSKGSAHGVRRAIYLFPLATNLENVIQKNEEPLWIARNVESVTDYWKVKWATPRSEKRKEYLDFFKDKFINDTIEELKKYKIQSLIK